MTRSAEDAAIVFNVIHGASEKDPGTITMPFHFDANIDLSKLRVGVRRPQNPNAPVDANFTAFLDKMKSLGATTHELPPPPTVAGAGGFGPGRPCRGGPGRS